MKSIVVSIITPKFGFPLCVSSKWVCIGNLALFKSEIEMVVGIWQMK